MSNGKYVVRLPRNSTAYRGIVIAACVAAISSCAQPDIEPTIDGNRLEFRIPDLNGDVVAWNDPRFQDKIVLVDIWGTWCPPCRESLPTLEDLQLTYADQGLVVVGIAFENEPDQEERREYLREFVSDIGVKYLVLDGGTTDQLEEQLPTLKGFQGFPTMIIVNRDGTVAHANTVFVPRELDQIRSEVVAALQRDV